MSFKNYGQHRRESQEEAGRGLHKVSSHPQGLMSGQNQGHSGRPRSVGEATTEGFGGV